MNPLIRWMKFNLVGVIGAAVQLMALATLNRRWPGQFLIASSVALELTLVHNFIWHLLYTWRDRQDVAPWQSRFVQFHCSTGIISLLGNLGLMRLFVRDLHLAVLPANLLAILCCAVVNFYVGNRWTFAVSGPQTPNAPFLLKSESSRS